MRDGRPLSGLSPQWDSSGASFVYRRWDRYGTGGREPRSFLNEKRRIPLGVTCDFSPDGMQVVTTRVSSCSTYVALWIIRFNDSEILEKTQITGLPEQAAAYSSRWIP